MTTRDRASEVVAVRTRSRVAHLFGFELLTRIRNWKDLAFYRAAADASYQHIDSLFGAPRENAINWALIETHWVDLMQVVLSIRQGRLSSTLLLRRLGTESRKNNIYKAFRELGRVIRTIMLLRYISEPELREEITAATNKVESYNEFSAWLRFGHDTIERNDPAEQEKIIKFNTLLANRVIFHTALDMTTVLRQLATFDPHLDPGQHVLRGHAYTLRMTWSTPARSGAVLTSPAIGYPSWDRAGSVAILASDPARSGCCTRRARPRRRLVSDGVKWDPRRSPATVFSSRSSAAICAVYRSSSASRRRVGAS